MPHPRSAPSLWNRLLCTASRPTTPRSTSGWLPAFGGVVAIDKTGFPKKGVHSAEIAWV